MAKDTHKILRRLADELIKEATDENCSAVLNEIIRILMRDEDVIIDGSPTESGNGQVEPAAITASDGLAYLNIYTDHDRFEACGGKACYTTNLKGLLGVAFEEDSIGGISINYARGKACVLIGKDQIYEALQEYLKTKEEK